MNKSNLFFVVAAGMALTACSFDDSMRTLEYDYDPAELNITASIGGMSVTRGTADYQNEQLDNTSTPAVYVCQNSSGTSYTTNYLTGQNYANIQMTSVADASPAKTSTLSISSVSGAPSKFYFPQDKGSLDVYLYAPYQSSGASLTAMPITVSTTQYNKAGYIASDFVFGNKTNVAYATSATAAVQLYHALTKLKFVIKDINGNKVNGLTKAELGPTGDLIKINATVNITTAVTSGNTDITTSVVQTGTSTGTVTLFDSSVSGADTWTNGTSEVLYAIIPPQDAKDVTLKLTIGTIYYSAKLKSSTFPLDPATEYTFNVTLGQEDLDITTVSITDWTRPTSPESTTVN